MRDYRRTHLLIAIVAIAAALPACQKVPMLPGISPYRIDIQQGNVVTQDMVDKLKPGMTKQQVRFVMGTPPIVDPFHKDRWDYVYYLNRAGRVAEHRRLVLLFDGEVLKRVEGDVVVGSGEKGVKPQAGAPSESVKPRAATAAETQPATAKPQEPAGADTQAQSAKPRETTPTDIRAQPPKPPENTAADARPQTPDPRETTAADSQPQTDKQATP